MQLTATSSSSPAVHQQLANQLRLPLSWACPLCDTAESGLNQLQEHIYALHVQPLEHARFKGNEAGLLAPQTAGPADEAGEEGSRGGRPAAESDDGSLIAKRQRGRRLLQRGNQLLRRGGQREQAHGQVGVAPQ